MTNPLPNAPPPSPAGQKLTKAHLIEGVVLKTGLSRRQSAQVVSAVLESVRSALRQGQAVNLPGVGTLNTRATASRRQALPSADLVSPALARKVVFKASLDLSNSL